MKRPKGLELAESLGSAIGRAVEPLRESAVLRVEKYCREYIARLVELLKAAGYDLNVVAPRPDSLRTGHIAYRQAMSLRDEYMAITTTANPTGCIDMAQIRGTKPHRVEVSETRIDKTVAEAMERASMEYDMFVYKLCKKVAGHTAATLDGDHVWSYSVLSVTHTDGTVSRWKTQQITNVSKYGKVFAQWPSRRMK